MNELTHLWKEKVIENGNVMQQFMHLDQITALSSNWSPALKYAYRQYMICYYKFNTDETSQKLLTLFAESQEKKHIMVGLCSDLVVLKKQALDSQNGMQTRWPLEPFPLCASHEDFLELVKKSNKPVNSVIGSTFSRDMHLTLVKLLLMQITGYLLKRGVALTVENFESQVCRPSTVKNFARWPVLRLLDFEVLSLIKLAQKDKEFMHSLRAVVERTHPGLTFFEVGTEASVKAEFEKFYRYVANGRHKEVAELMSKSSGTLWA